MDKNDDRVVAVAAGHASSFVVTNRGEVYSWGSRMFGALGQDGEDNKDNEKKKANDRDREKKRAQEAEEGEKQEKNDKVVLAPKLITGTHQTVGTSRRVRYGRVAAVFDCVRGVGGVWQGWRTCVCLRSPSWATTSWQSPRTDGETPDTHCERHGPNTHCATEELVFSVCGKVESGCLCTHALPSLYRLFGWGRNQFGQLGIDQMCPFVEKPTQVRRSCHASY
jgi:alpha-tubulin suppressor-like RCC1 family protein